MIMWMPDANRPQSKYRSDRVAEAARSEYEAKPVSLTEVGKAIELAEDFAVLCEVVHPERMLAVLGDPAATFVLEAQEPVIIQAAAKQSRLPDSVRMASATLFDKGVEAFSEVGEWRLHRIFSCGSERRLNI